MPLVRGDYEYPSSSPHENPRHGFVGSCASNGYDPSDMRQDSLRDIMPEERDESKCDLGNGRMESRSELIERLKRQSPTWIPPDITSASPQILERSQPIAIRTSNSPLLPAAEITERRPESRGLENTALADPLSIERPRSALHSGDFRQDSPPKNDSEGIPVTPRGASAQKRGEWFSTSPTTPWYTPSLPSSSHFSHLNAHVPPYDAFDTFKAASRSRAESYSSLSSSFVLRPPTSPLAQQSNSNDFEAADSRDLRRRPGSPDMSARRHTFSPHSFQRMLRSPSEQEPVYGFMGRLPNLRREGSYTYQAHQPRRSITSISGPLSVSASNTPIPFSRRPSASSDLSPLQHAPMVGPYEESILRGRMSTLPSRPLDFVAQIGVLAKGDCKPSLRCPPHISIRFPAVFYSYGDSKPHSTIANDGPSPYVGLIDLENSSNQNGDAGNFVRTRHSVDEIDDAGSGMDDSLDGQSGVSPLDRRRRKLKDRHIHSSKKAPKGSYRIPQQGQLQIVIKNPNKTAVKLFLVPYDLTNMEAGQKTFIRQRSYSAGPIIDMPVSARKNLGTDRPEAAIWNTDDPKDRPVLRYLIHLNICSPSSGRFYLHRSIRVVFANRVPDDKEKLRNEIQLPEPRYSAYRPDQVSSGKSQGW